MFMRKYCSAHYCFVVLAYAFMSRCRVVTRLLYGMRSVCHPLFSGEVKIYVMQYMFIVGIVLLALLKLVIDTVSF